MSDDDICPACDQPVQLREPSYPPRVTRCLCNGADLRAEITRLRADLDAAVSVLQLLDITFYDDGIHILDAIGQEFHADEATLRRLLGEADDD